MPTELVLGNGLSADAGKWDVNNREGSEKNNFSSYKEANALCMEDLYFPMIPKALNNFVESEKAQILKLIEEVLLNNIH